MNINTNQEIFNEDVIFSLVNFSNFHIKKFLFKDILNYIFKINEDAQNKQIKFNSKINYVINCFADNNINNRLQIDQPLFNSNTIEELKELINQLNPPPDNMVNNIKHLINCINSLNANNCNCYVLQRTVYYIAVSILFYKNLGIKNEQNNYLVSIIVNGINDVVTTIDFEEKIEKFTKFFKTLFAASLSTIFNKDFTALNKMDLKSLLYILNLCKIKLEETSLLNYLSRNITDFNKSSYDFLFKEICDAFNALPKFISSGNQIPYIYNNSFLNFELIKKIIKLPYFNENFKESNLEVVYILNLSPNERNLILQNKPALYFKFIELFFKNVNYSTKLEYLKKIYFDINSTEEILKDNLYRYVIECLTSSELSEGEAQFIIENLIPYYATYIFDDFYSESKSSFFVKKTLALFNENEIKNFVSLAILQKGYTFNIAKFINEFDLFSDDEKLNFLFAKSLKVFEEFLTNYSHLVHLNFYSSEKIFQKIINLLEANEISASTISMIFIWIDSHDDLYLSTELTEQFSLMLVNHFNLDALSLIPNEFLSDTLCTKILDILKRNSCQLPVMSNIELFNFLRTYSNTNPFFNPSKLDLLPTEVKFHIASYLPLRSLESLSLTSKRNFEIYGNEPYLIRENSIIFREILFYLFPELNWDDHRVSFYKKSEEIDFFIEDKFEKTINQLFLKLNKHENLNLHEQKKFLYLFQTLLENGLFNPTVDLSLETIEVDYISNYYEVKKTLFKIINNFLKEHSNELIKYRYVNFFLFLNAINIKLPQSIIDDIIKYYSFPIQVLFNTHYKDCDLDTVALELQKNNFINLTFLEKLIFNNQIDSSVLLKLFFHAKQINNDLNFIKKLLSYSRSYLRFILSEINFSIDFEWRINFLKEIDFFLNDFNLILKFLSLNDSDSIKEHINVLAEIYPLGLIKSCLYERNGLNLEFLSKNKALKVVNLAAKKNGYHSELYQYIKKRKLDLSKDRIFKYAIHPNTDFKDLLRDFSKKFARNKIKLNYQELKDLVNFHCDKITPRHTRYDVPFNFYFEFVNFTNDQKLELLSFIINKLKLNCLKVISKTSLFNECKRLNDDFFIDFITSLLQNETDLISFNKNFKYICELIGKTKATELRSFLLRKRGSSIQKIRLNSKRKK